jgi:hypothetical protein
MSIPRRQHASKISRQRDETKNPANQKSVANHSPYPQIKNSDVKSDQSRVAKIQLQNIIEQQFNQAIQDQRQRQNNRPPVSLVQDIQKDNCHYRQSHCHNRQPQNILGSLKSFGSGEKHTCHQKIHYIGDQE